MDRSLRPVISAVDTCSDTHHRIRIFWMMVLCAAIVILPAFGQSVTQRIIDKYDGMPVPNASITLYVHQNGIANALSVTTNPNGIYSTTITDIRIEGSVPSRYEVSQPYPNPFNPKTYINISLPRTSHVILKVYNYLGQFIGTIIDRQLGAGTYAIPIDILEGKAGGVYFAVPEIDGRRQGVKKLAFIYGTQHATTPNLTETNLSAKAAGQTNMLDKTSATVILDSITVSGDRIKTTNTAYGISISNDNTLSDLAIDVYRRLELNLRYLLDYPNQVPVPNASITLTDTTNGHANNSTSNSNGQASFNLLPRSYRVNITHPAIWDRETYYDLTTDKTVNEYVTDTTRCTSRIKDFFERLYGPSDSRTGMQTCRLKKKFIEIQIHNDSTNQEAQDLLDVYSAEFDTLNNITKLTPRNPEGLFTNQTINITQNPVPRGTYGYYTVEIPDPWPYGGGVVAVGISRVDLNNAEIVSGETAWKPGLAKISIKLAAKHEITRVFASITGLDLSDDFITVMDPAGNWTYTTADSIANRIFFYQPGGTTGIQKDEGWDNWISKPALFKSSPNHVYIYHMTRLVGDKLVTDTYQATEEEYKAKGLEGLIKERIRELK